jgi:ketosteroid isomerase-like protein
MSNHKSTVERYIQGFNRADNEQILSCLTEDVVWQLHGYKTLTGKDAFRKEIESGASQGVPALTLDRLIEEGDTVVATGEGSLATDGDKPRRFVFSEVFTFTGDAVNRLDTYHLWLD